MLSQEKVVIDTELASVLYFAIGYQNHSDLYPPDITKVRKATVMLILGRFAISDSAHSDEFVKFKKTAARRWVNANL